MYLLAHLATILCTASIITCLWWGGGEVGKREISAVAEIHAFIKTACMFASYKNAHNQSENIISPSNRRILTTCEG